jgi:hypothetical protein
MPPITAKLYKALKAANVSEDQAEAVAEEAAGYENRLAKIEGELRLLQWMVGLNAALTILALGLVLRKSLP